jgi:hypothetical protein
MSDRIETEDWIEVAERLYRLKNPQSKMDCPSYVYEIVEKWRREWYQADTQLSLFDWCVQNKK